jgi:hypothetical protein
MAKLLEKPAHRIGYDDDLYAWAFEQAAVLRAKRDPDIDFEHIAEELEAMGGSEKREIASRLAVLIQHLLKWEHQPARRSNSWRASILVARAAIEQTIDASPSLRRYPHEPLAKAYEIARLKAADDMGLQTRALPVTCPYSVEQILDETFYPGPSEPFPE